MSIKYNINHKSFDMSIKYIKINVINISNDFQSNSRFCNTLFNKNYRMCHITKFDTLMSFDPETYIYIYIYISQNPLTPTSLTSLNNVLIDISFIKSTVGLKFYII
jgi:hypothetical protein